MCINRKRVLSELLIFQNEDAEVLFSPTGKVKIMVRPVWMIGSRNPDYVIRTNWDINRFFNIFDVQMLFKSIIGITLKVYIKYQLILFILDFTTFPHFFVNIMFAKCKKMHVLCARENSCA